MPNLDLEILQIMYGDTPVEKIMKGDSLVWPPAEPLYDAQVEYLESSGTQYIDTGIVGSSNLSIKLTCYYPKTSSSIASQGFIFGSRVANNSKQYGLICSYTKTFRYGNNNSNDWSNPTARILVFDNSDSHNALKVYDTDDNLVTTLTATASTFNNNLNIYLFAINNNGSALNYSHKIYALQLYENSTLVRNFIPVRVGQVGYMYDRVSGELFGNSGSGSFTLGPDVT